MLNISDLGSNWYPGQSKVCTISKQVFTKTKTNKTLIIENQGKTSGAKSKTRS